MINMEGLRVYNRDRFDGAEMSFVTRIEPTGRKLLDARVVLPSGEYPHTVLVEATPARQYHPHAVIRNGEWHATILGPNIWAHGLSIDFQQDKIAGYEWTDHLMEGDVIIPLGDSPHSDKVRGWYRNHMKKCIENALDRSMRSGSYAIY